MEWAGDGEGEGDGGFLTVRLCSSNPIQHVKIELNVKTTTLHRTRAQIA